jgi:hypothetical protein
MGRTTGSVNVAFTAMSGFGASWFAIREVETVLKGAVQPKGRHVMTAPREPVDPSTSERSRVARRNDGRPRQWCWQRTERFALQRCRDEGQRAERPHRTNIGANSAAVSWRSVRSTRSGSAWHR